MMAGVATETIVVSTRIMKNPMHRAKSAGHGLFSSVAVVGAAVWVMVLVNTGAWTMHLGCIVHAPVLTRTMTHTAAPTTATEEKSPWPALFALCIGFFMILVDTTIVSVATPAIIEDLHAGVNDVVWVTSAYLLAYAVPVLITGRLGDRFGPKNIYLIGLTVFTLASLWCGLTNTIEMLIVARVFQGFGAALMTPQTMAVITRIFPADRRGQAMALWGATAGVATLVGPILGGILVDA